MNPDQHRKTQFSIFYVVVGLLVILGLQWFLGMGLATDVSYSDFKAALAAGKVREVVVSPSDIQGIMSGAGGPKGEKRPADTIGNAVHVMRIAARVRSH